MGCVTSKTDINDLHPNVFQVMNVDELCTPLHPGQLEVGDTDLVLHQRGKTPVRWPINCLRRYGFDRQLFSFECGRRCPTGPGIYAFKCTRAEQLFNLLHTQMRNNNPGDDVVMNSDDFTPRQAESNYLEPAPLQIRHNGNRVSIHTGRLSSVGSSNGPLSPLATSPSPPPPPPPPSATDDRHRTLGHSYSNSTAITDLCSPPCKEPPPPPLTLTAKIDIMPTSLVSDAETTHADLDPTEESLSSPIYMNIIPGQEIAYISGDAPPRPLSDPESRHCYANLDLGEIEGRYPTTFQLSGPPTPLAQINYILLDLDQMSSSSSLTGAVGQLNSPVTLAPESPVKPSDGYATIDFDRTVALGSVTCPTISDDGSRKTRHNSTMSELTAAEEKEKEVKRTRHNSTISELMAPLTARLSSSLSE